jgi:hypothetical protein
MDKRFRLLFSLLVLLNVIIGGLGFVRLFSWKSLLGIDKLFYIFISLLFLFSMYIAFLFSKLDDVRSDADVINGVAKAIKKESNKNDEELKELRKELDKVPVIPVDTSILRNPVPRPIPPIVRTLTEDVSMYQDRNIIKPPITQEDKDEYNGVF